jgi:hypothetical protein
LTLRTNGRTLPGDVASFLREADRRIERFRGDHHIPGFVPSDFARAYEVLAALAGGNVTAGNLFCEWGSGFGVVACLAAMLDFDSCGIEIEGELVEEAEQLADDFGLPVQFIRGSFIPEGSEVRLAPGDGFSWLTTEGDGTQEELGLGPDDFDVIFAYPWPDEEQVIGDLFEQHASVGAVLVTYHGHDDLRLRRKEGRKSRRQGKR